MRIMLAIGQAWPSPAWGPPTLWTGVSLSEFGAGKGCIRVDNRTAHEIRVIFAEDEFSRVLVDRIANV